jgi:N-acetylglucosamine-6-phosphate deacetylase
MKDLIFRNCKVALCNEIKENQTVVISQGKIFAITGESFGENSAAEVIDAEGKLLTPGLMDIQINGGFGFDFTRDPQSIWQVGQQLVSLGVTCFLPTIITSPLEKIQHALSIWKAGKPEDYKGAIPLGWHVEGPFLNPQKKGAHQAEYLRLPERHLIADWSPENGVRLVTLAPELSGQEYIVKDLSSRGVVVSIGHSNASAEQADQAIAWGARAGTHLFNAMPELHHRQPGLTGAILTNDDVFTGIIVDGIHVDQRMVKLAFRVKGPNRLVLITDAMEALGMKPGTYKLADKNVIVENSSARLQDGTLAGSILSLPEALENTMRFTGCSLSEAVTMATETPAQLFGIDSKGRIAVGKDADLVLWDEGFKPNTVVIAGEIVNR